MINTLSYSSENNVSFRAFSWLMVIIASLSIHFFVLSFYRDKPVEKKGASLPGIHIGLKTINASKPVKASQQKSAEVIEKPVIEKVIKPIVEPKIAEVKPKPKKTIKKTKNPKLTPKAAKKVIPEVANVTLTKVEEVIDDHTSELNENNSRTEQSIAQDDSISGGGNPQAIADYKTLLSAWLEKHKRYPSSARRRGQQDIIEISFSIDSSGNILSYHITSPSRYKSLNKAIKRLMAKANPVPRPPAELASLSFSVPISFVLK